MEGKVIIFSAPSGSGKSTLVNYLLGIFPPLEFSVSCTTRKPRGEEKNGKEYYFLNIENFKDKIKNNEFVEYEEVYPGCFYGTLKEEVERIWKMGKIVIFDVDVKGGVNLKKYFKEKALSVFIKPPSVEVLYERLVSRGTDSQEVIELRVAKAKEELLYQNQFDKIIVNDVLEQAKEELYSQIKEFLA